jgi:hypothetical protein
LGNSVIREAVDHVSSLRKRLEDSTTGTFSLEENVVKPRNYLRLIQQDSGLQL